MEFKPFETEVLNGFQSHIPPPSFGLEMRKAFFPYLQDKFLAHGSYGAASVVALKVAQSWQIELERNPADFYHNVLYDYLVRSIRHLARYLCNTNPMNLMLVKNVEVGLQSVLKSYPFEEEKGIAFFDITYGAVKTSLDIIAQEKGLKLYQVILTFPMTKETILLDMRRFLDNHSSLISLFLLEHISSPTAILFPIKEIAALIKSYDSRIAVLVDGAHGIGQLDPLALNFDDGAIDFYTSNLHKWFCSPRGCAFLWICPKHHSTIKPLVVSWGWSYPIQSKFIWQGTEDFSPFLAVPIMIRFFSWISTQSSSPSLVIRNHNLARWCGQYLADVWQTEELVSEDELVASMVCVKLPMPFGNQEILPESTEYAKIIYQIKSVHKIEAPTFLFQGCRWIRISIHIYNTESDCLELAEKVLQVLGYPNSFIEERKLLGGNKS
jgi:isopenicillin-N epimerase